MMMMMMMADSRLHPAAAHRDQSQPLEGPKTTGSRQPRQVNTAAAHVKEHNDYDTTEVDNLSQEQFGGRKDIFIKLIKVVCRECVLYSCFTPHFSLLYLLSRWQHLVTKALKIRLIYST